jgi:hypothetical protein
MSGDESDGGIDGFRERVAAAAATELDRLGSQQLLLALTGADLSSAAVLAAAAESEATAAATFERWAADETDDRAAERWERAAAREREHAARVVEAAESEAEVAPAADSDPGTDADADADPDALHEHLRGLDDPVERTGGFVGRCLVADRTLLQLVNFFVNEADEPRADLFRDLRAETGESLAAGLELLERVCADDADRDRAAAAATGAIRAAYDAYADSLTDLGMDPRPIC